MFKRNTNYDVRVYGRDTDITAKEVVIYPENKLEPLVVSSDFGDCLVLTSDLYDLFNQQRIANLGADVVRDFIARNYPVSSAISDRISRMSDDEILSSIKPRNIQSYSELMMWTKYLQNQINNAVEATAVTEVTETTETSKEVNNETSEPSESSN